MSEDLLIERRGRVAVFTINRPEKRNSLTPEILFRLGDALQELADADEVRAVVLRGQAARPSPPAMTSAVSRAAAGVLPSGKETRWSTA